MDRELEFDIEIKNLIRDEQIVVPQLINRRIKETIDAIPNRSFHNKMLNNKILIIIAILLAVIPLTAFGTSFIFKDKMKEAIFNYETLEANYTEQIYNLTNKYYLAIDYTNNRAIGTISDKDNRLKAEYLVENNKQLFYEHIPNTFTEVPVLDMKRKRPSQRTLTLERHNDINLPSNPLALPLGGAAIAIDPAQYASDVMEFGTVTKKGKTIYLERPVEIVNIKLPPSPYQEFDRIEFYIDDKTGVILKMTKYKENNIVYEIKAENFKVNHKIDSNLFKINIPKTAKLGRDY